jgi:hypothetical protein
MRYTYRLVAVNWIEMRPLRWVIKAIIPRALRSLGFEDVSFIDPQLSHKGRRSLLVN